jgi:hypothetical protein
MLIDKACFERGCACYDDRLDKDAVEVVRKEWVDLTDDEIAEAVGAPLDMVYLQDFRKVLAKAKEKNGG